MKQTALYVKSFFGENHGVEVVKGSVAEERDWSCLWIMKSYIFVIEIYKYS